MQEPLNAPIIHSSPKKKVTMLKSGAVIASHRLDQYRADGWVNILTGLGLGNDKKTAGQLVYNKLVEIDVETLYAGDDMSARIIDLLPDNAVRKWVDYQGLDEQDELALVEKLADIEAKKKYLQALKWARLYGGSGLLVGTDEMGDLTEPLVPEEIDNVLSLTLITRYELYPSQLQYDPLKKNFGYPEFYRLQLRGASPINGHEVHHSRIIRFDGVELPRRLHIQNQYWADSVLSRVYEIIRNFNTTHNSLATVMQDFRIGIFKLKNLAEMIAMGDDGLVQKRLALVDAAKSVARSIVIDAEGEDFEQATGNLTGVKDLIEAVNDRFVAATGIPITVLFGRSPQGLGGSGRHEETNWYDHVSAYQEDTVKPPLKRLCEIVLKSKQGPTSGKMPVGFGITFNPLWQLDDKEQADMRYTQSQADEKYISNGVVTPEEIAISRFGGEKWDAHTKIDLDMRRAVKPQAQQTAEGQGAVGGNQPITPAAETPPNLQKGILESPTHIPPVELQETGQVAEQSGPISTLSEREPNDDESDLTPGKPFTDPTSFRGNLLNAQNDDAKHVSTVAVMHGTKMLMGKRRDTGRWTHPGGHLDPKETALDGAVRELKEETGIDSKSHQLEHLGSQPVKTHTGKNYVIHAFKMNVDDKLSTTMRNDPDQEVERWEWVDTKDGLPDHVAGNLHSPKNLLLQLMGHQKRHDHFLDMPVGRLDHDSSLIISGNLNERGATVSAVDPTGIEQVSQEERQKSNATGDAVNGQSRPMQTIILSKEHFKSATAARKVAQQFAKGQELQSVDETGTSYRFRLRSPGDFISGSMKTFQPEGKPGVSIVFGTLKK